MKRFFRNFRTALVACVVATTAAAIPTLANAEDILTIGNAAPALDIEHWVQDGEGKFGKVTKFEKGKVYVVEFWATWCGPCVASMPHIVEMQKKYADKGVQIISISDEDLKTVEDFLKREVPRAEEKMTFKDLTKSYCLTTDPDRSSSEAYMEAAGQNGIPCAFLVGKDSKIEWIGHPMQLDEPLEKVVAGTWDREAFAKEFTEQQQAEALMMKVQKEVGALLKQRKFPAALEKFDALTSDIKNPEMKMQFTMMKLNLHQIASSPKEEVAKTLTSAIAQAGEASKKNPMMANQIAWTIYEMTEQGKIEKNEAVLKDALNLATSAVGKMDGNSKGATLDTIAHLHHMLGNLQDAIKAQEEAVKLGGGQQDAEIKAFLEELKEELKAKK